MSDTDKISKRRLVIGAIAAVAIMLGVIAISIVGSNIRANDEKERQLELEKQAIQEVDLAVDTEIASSYIKVSIGGNPTSEPQNLSIIQKWLDSNPYVEIIDILPDSTAFGVDGVTIVYRKSVTEKYYRAILDDNNFNLKDYVTATQITNSANNQDYRIYLIIIKSDIPSKSVV